MDKLNNYYTHDCGCKFKRFDDEKMGDSPVPSIEIDYYNINYNCPKIWNMLCDGKTIGLFQIEQSLGRNWSKKMVPSSLGDVAALISAIRPGALKAKMEDGKSAAQHLVDRKNGLEEYEPIDSSIEEITEETFGIILYQETAMKIAVRVAGFNEQQADTLRKCITDDTMFVSKTRGWISVRELLDSGYSNEEFLIMNEHGRQEWKKISNIWSTGIQAVTQINTNYGYSICTTSNHQFLTNSNWKDSEDLTTEDFLVAASEVSFDGDDEITADMAIIISGLITERYFTKKTKLGNRTSCHFTSHDSKFMNIFCNAYFNEFGIFPSLSNNGQQARISSKHRDIINGYLEYGFSNSKYIPKIMMKMKLQSMSKFLSFMLGAEGGISESGQFEYSSKSEQCINQIKLLLLRFGIRGLIYKKINKKYNEYYYYLYINDLEEQKKLLCKLSFLWPDYKISDLMKLINKKTNNYTIDIIPSNIVKKIRKEYPFIVNGEGGSVYSKNISRIRFNRLANKTNDKKWIDFVNGKHSYTKIVNIDKDVHNVETFDFTMEDNSTPYIIANGLVIHNSMGKKDATLMAKTRIWFIDGCAQTNIISNEKANFIFDIIEKANRYSFNKCISWNTLVEKQNGEIIKAFDVKIGDSIKCPSANGGGTKYCTVLNRYLNGKKDLYRVSFYNGKTIDCTLDHKFLSNDYNVYPLHTILFDNKFVIHDVEIGDDFQSIKNIIYIGQDETLDLEIDDKYHCFFGNGIAISNSHAFCYGDIALWCTVAKAHFPQEFFCGYLRNAENKADKKSEVATLVSDAKQFNVDVLRPSILELNKNFKLENLSIRCGIGNIAGIGEKSVEKLIRSVAKIEQLRNKSIRQFSWYEILLFLTPEATKTIIQNMIVVGAFAHLGMYRKYLLFEYNKFLDLKDKEIGYLISNSDKYEDLSSGLQDMLFNFKLTEPRKNKIRDLLNMLNNPSSELEDSAEWISNNEEKLIGIPITCMKLDECNTAFGNCDCVDVEKNQLPEIRIAAQLRTVSPYVPKQGKLEGMTMAYLILADRTGSCEAVAFPRQFEEYEYLLFEGNTVGITGKKSNSGGLQITKVIQL